MSAGERDRTTRRCAWVRELLRRHWRRHPLDCLLVAFLTVVALVAFVAWEIAPYCCGNPVEMLEAQTPVREFYDAFGNLVFREPTYDYQWRLDVPLSEISPEVQRVILSVEDRDFYRHDGVNRLAILRAFCQNAVSGRVLSGSSTVTMQLVGMVLPRPPRGDTLARWRRKWLQAALARRLERMRNKRWIFENYLNRIPFGGKIYGIEAASLFYFGLPARELNLSEALLLCGVPQRPNALRPDRHFEAAWARQRVVIKILRHNGDVSRDDILSLRRRDSVRMRDLGQPSSLRVPGHHGNEHFIRLARRAADNALQVRTSWNENRQQLLLATLREQVACLEGVSDGAGVIVENATGRVMALVGTLDYAEKRAGQVNAAIARREAGSTLKPFIYAEAIDGGLICADTRVFDVPIRYGNYSPGNYDGTYQGGVSARTALSKSLNTPAVRILARLGAKRMLEKLRLLGMLRWNVWQRDDELAQELGLSLALGTGGYRLVDLAEAYVALARGGVRCPLRYTLDHAGQSSEDTRVFTPGTAYMVTSMLMSRHLPGVSFDVAWKTGTSNGHRDAWCVGYTPDYTVCVWIGNKSGKGSAALVGADAAAPVVAAVMNALYAGGSPGGFPIEEHLQTVRLCRRTGLRAQEGVCAEEYDGSCPRDVVLRRCDVCSRREMRGIMMYSPVSQVYYVRPGETSVYIRLDCNERDVHWYVDDLYRGFLAPNTRLEFKIGRHCVRAVSENPQVQPARVNFEVWQYKR